MGSEGDSFFGDAAQVVEAENLETARVRQNRTGPAHELVQSAKAANQFMPRTQIEMVGISQNNLGVKIFKDILRDSFNRSLRSNGHKDRRFYRAVCRRDGCKTRRASFGRNCKGKGHILILQRGVAIAGS